MTAVDRRQFLRIAGFSAAALAAWRLGAGLRGPVEVRAARVLMGTVANLTLYGEDRAAAEEAAAAALARMSGLEALLSRHQPASEVSRLNRHGRLAAASAPLQEIIAAARRLSELSGGAFDITILPLQALYQQAHARGALPAAAEIAAALRRVDYRALRVSGGEVSFAAPGMGITLDGIAKGYIVDAGTAVLREHGFPAVLVEAGGDLMAAGSRGDARPWRLGVQAPRAQEDAIPARFSLRNQAAATSGDYMQPYSADLSRHHILDPRHGRSAPEPASATIIAPSAMLADGLATAVMVLGPQAGLRLVEALPGCEAYVLGKELAVWQTAGFAA